MKNHSFHEKRQGFIVRKKAQKASQSSKRNLSHDITPTNHSTITSQLDKYPGQIRRMKKENRSIQKIDEEVYYNSDHYVKYQIMKRPAVKYEEVQHIAIQVRKSPTKQINEKVQHIQGSHNKKQEASRDQLKNIHSQFELNKFQQIYFLLKEIIHSMQTNEIEVLKSIRPYIRLVSSESIDITNGLKFITNKREILKQSFAIERQAVIIVCFTIAINRYEEMKSYCSNLLKYAFQNHLIALNLLTQQTNSYVQSLLDENNKGYLKGKGFEDIRSTNQLMRTLIIKISKSDPLFSNQFCKILENYSSQSVKTQLYSILTLFSFYLHSIKAIDRVPYLSASPGPFVLQYPNKQYTLVMDFANIFLDNSISLKKHLSKKDQFMLRPYTQYFLNEVEKYFDIISFSDMLPIQSNKILNKVDQRKCVRHRLYKYHIDYEVRKKQVEKIGRNLDRLILLDSVQSLKTDNLILINQWKGQSNDAVLAEICPLLALIAVKKLSALESIKKIQQAISTNASLGLKYINCGLNL